MVKTASDVMTLAVEFGTVSYGVKTARIGLVVNRNQLPLAKADEIFVDRRIECKLVLNRKGEADGQENFLGDKDHQIVGVCDVNRFGVGAETYTSGLTFAISSIDVDEFTKFRYGTGKLVIDSVSEIPASTPKETVAHESDTEDEEDQDEDKPRRNRKAK